VAGLELPGKEQVTMSAHALFQANSHELPETVLGSWVRRSTTWLRSGTFRGRDGDLAPLKSADGSTAEQVGFANPRSEDYCLGNLPPQTADSRSFGRRSACRAGPNFTGTIVLRVHERARSAKGPLTKAASADTG
jgi:hypothetical protein